MEPPSIYPSVYSYPIPSAAVQWPKRVPVNRYTDMFRMVIAYTYDLKKHGVLDEYLEKGYKYIRRRDSAPFRNIVRTPTVGCLVELSVQQTLGSVPIQSPQGRAIIKKVCYF